VKKRYPKYYEKFLSFCIERNPWKKVASKYYFDLERYRINEKEMKFKGWLKWVTSNGIRLSDWSNYTDREGEICVDYIVKFENLEEELNDVIKKTNMSLDELGNLPKANSNPRNEKKYEDIYDKESKKMVEKEFEKEIEYFGYSF